MDTSLSTTDGPETQVKYFTPEPSLNIREGQACFDT
jgi:hypothetical protein